MSVSYKDHRHQYKCDGARNKYGKPSCQFLSGHRIDDAVVEEFFRALEPAHIDALEKVSAKQVQHQREREKHLAQEVARLEYEARRAERQYDNVDPENRLIAATLEKKWESALADLQRAQAQLTEAKEAAPTAIRIPTDLRLSFADVGRKLPQMWPRLTAEARKSLLRTLVEAVNLFRDSEGVAIIRIVWRGGAVTERRVRVPVQSFRYSETEARVADRIRELTEGGVAIPQIVERLNKEHLSPCRGGSFTPQIIIKLKRRYGIVSNLEQLRRDGGIASAYTVNELAKLLKVHPAWFYRRIGDGTIRVETDEKFGCYLFPPTQASIDQLKRLKKGEVPHASFQKVQHTG